MFLARKMARPTFPPLPRPSRGQVSAPSRKNDLYFACRGRIKITMASVNRQRKVFRKRDKGKNKHNAGFHHRDNEHFSTDYWSWSEAYYRWSFSEPLSPVYMVPADSSYDYIQHSIDASRSDTLVKAETLRARGYYNFAHHVVQSDCPRIRRFERLPPALRDFAAGDDRRDIDARTSEQHAKLLVRVVSKFLAL